MKTITNIKGMLITVLALFALTATSNAAGIGGVYLEVGSSAIGVAVEGDHNDKNGRIATGALGKTAITASYGLGFMTDRARKIGIDAGYMVTPGQAKLSHTSTSRTADKVSLDVSDATQYYFAPMLNITEDASLYVKFGFDSTDLTTVGDVNKINSMDGDTLAVGTVMSWGSNLYLRTEAGRTTYDKLTFTGLGTADGVSTSDSIRVTPEINYGKVAIGYKF
jgi:hypothetical protein